MCKPKILNSGALLKGVFIIADVPNLILGTDFFQHFGLLRYMNNRRLAGPVTSLKTKVFIRANEQWSPSLACSTTTKQIKALLEKYPTINPPSFNKTNLNHKVTHHIATTGPSERPSRLSPEKNGIDYMLELGIIRPSQRDWVSPLHMIPKKGGSWRPCGNYVALNSISQADLYPLLYLHDVTSQIQGKIYFQK